MLLKYLSPYHLTRMVTICFRTNEFNVHFNNFSTASAPITISSREHNHYRHEGNKFIFTETLLMK